MSGEITRATPRRGCIADCGPRIADSMEDSGLRVADSIDDWAVSFRNPKSAFGNKSAVRNPQSAISFSSTTAGAWKHNDFPPPVGRTTTLSRASRIACIASRWRGRNSEKPQTRCSASVRRRSASGVLVLDVVIDQALEFDRELVVGAVQRLDVLTVDDH